MSLTKQEGALVLRKVSDMIIELIYNDDETGHKSIIPDGTSVGEVVTLLIGSVVVAVLRQYKEGNELKELESAILNAVVASVESIRTMREKTSHADKNN